jgi:cell division protein ZapA
MAEVRLTIAAREYIVTCRDGEEGRLVELGQMVDAKVREAGGSAGGLNESRQLLFAALLLADQLHDNGGSSGSGTASVGISAELAAQMAQTIDKLAARVESFAAGLEEQATSA